MKADTMASADTPGGRSPTVAAEQRITQIVRGAARLFDTVGYHETSMEMVAEAAQLRKPTLYHYIKSKEEILLRIHQALIDDFAGTHRARLDQGLDREALLLGIVTDILHAIADNQGYVRAFFEHYRELDPSLRAQISAKRQAYFKSVTDVIADGVAAGVYHTDDVRLSALFLLGQVNWSYQWHVPGVSPAPAVIAHQILDGFLHGMARPAPQAGSRPAPARRPRPL